MFFLGPLIIHFEKDYYIFSSRFITAVYSFGINIRTLHSIGTDLDWLFIIKFPLNFVMSSYFYVNII